MSVLSAVNQDHSAIDFVALNTDAGIRIDFSDVSAQSPVLADGAYFVCTSAACLIAVGTNPTAVDTGASMPLFGAAVLPLFVERAGKKIAVRALSAGGSGSLWIIPAKRG